MDNAKNIEAVDRIGTAVAAILGMTYAPDVDPDGHRMDASGSLYDNEGDRIRLVAGVYGKPGRLVIYGCLPRDDEGRYVRPQDFRTTHDGRPVTALRLDITVSIDKTPSQIAADIKRRLVPDWSTAVWIVREGLAARRAYKDASTTLAGDLAAILGVPLAAGADTFRLPSSLPAYGDVRVHGEAVTMDLRSMPADVAKRVLKALKG